MGWQLDGESATLECSDGGQVTVKLSRVSLALSHSLVVQLRTAQDSNFADVYVEVIGRVKDNVITEYAS